MPNQSLWKPTPDGPHLAGDHFGDNEATDAFVVTYTMDTHPNARVSVYFGVVYPEKIGRYCPTSEVCFEILDDNGEVIDDVTHLNDEIFPFDYATRDEATAAVRDEVEKWQNTTWRMEDFFDGVNPR